MLKPVIALTVSAWHVLVRYWTIPSSAGAEDFKNAVDVLRTAQHKWPVTCELMTQRLLKEGTVVNVATVRDVATIVGIIVGAVSLALAAWNTSITRRTNRARFWLDLRKFFAEHDEVHRLLRPGGKWADPEMGPESADDWAKVEAYLGLFETCEDLLASRLVDLESFSRSYKYRVQNITANTRIVQAKLVERGQYWERFRHLAERLDIQLPPVQGLM